MKTLDALEVKNKKVLMRVDFNVPVDKSGQITDDTRIREALPSINYVLEHGGSVILMSHFGRPNGKPDPKFSLRACAEHLSKLLHKPVLFAPDCIGNQTEHMAVSLKPGSILLLENLRFYPAEENPDLDPSFAQNLARLGDCYVDDAFGAAHRKHSSIYYLPRLFPGKTAAGLLMQKEFKALTSLLIKPQKPFYTIIGGAKVSSKLGVLISLTNKVDALFIGGAMAFTFLKANGVDIGDSLYEEELQGQAKNFLKLCATKNIPVFLPEDFLATDQDSAKKIFSSQEGIPEGWKGMDIGPATISKWEAELKKAATIFWNGPLGVFEIPAFAEGTRAIAQAIASSKSVTVIGGGDSVSAIKQMNLENKFTFISTGGGACLEFLEYGHLPGIDILNNES